MSLVSRPCSHSWRSGPETRSRASEADRSATATSVWSASYRAWNEWAMLRLMRASVRYSTWFTALLLSAPAQGQPAAAVEDTVLSASFQILVQGRSVGTEEVSVVQMDGRTVIRSTA